MQETPDALPDDQTPPNTVSLNVYDELVDVSSKPGDGVVVSGIYRSVPVRSNPRQTVLKSLFQDLLGRRPCYTWGVGTLGLDKSTRPAEGDRVFGADGLGHRGDEDEVKKGTQSPKAEVEQK